MLPGRVHGGNGGDLRWTGRFYDTVVSVYQLGSVVAYRFYFFFALF